jgi:large subunit ribosomal protein L15
MINLSNLTPGRGARKKGKRLGRGPGSGSGKTSGRGHKGQNSRGSGKGPWFEGGQTPLHRRLPKRGFHNPTRKIFQVVNLRDLEARFSDNEEVTPETLRTKGLIKKRGLPVKLLAQGTLTKKLTVKVNAVSAAAARAVESAGGTVVLLGPKGPGGES